MSNVAVSFQSGVELTVVRFSVQEHLSAAFLIQLDAIGPPDLDPRAIAGRGAAFALQGRGGRRVWTGVCTRITQTQNHGDTASYTVTLAPALWLLSRRRNHRVFQHLSVPEIAERLLAEWGIRPVLKLEQSYPKLEYRVQYGETDYNFLRRQLADAGISFFFTLGEDAETKAEETHLVLTDAPQHGEPRARHLPFVAESALADRQEHVSHVTVTSEVRPGKVALRDHDLRRPTYPLLGQYAASAQPESLLEEYVYEPGVAAAASAADGTTPVADRPLPYRQTDAVAAAQARILGESLRPGGLAINFTTSVVDLAAGAVFVVEGHPHPAVASARGLLVVEAWITGEPQGEWSQTGLAVPADEPFRPPRASTARPSDRTDEVDIFASQFVPQKPRVPGIESAIVVGPQGEEIHTDELGRVRLQFHWDREGRFDEHSSCWVRVSQAWAGSGFGATFLPRVGHEVLVAFVGGDPDLPVIVGRVHAPTIPAPYTLPENKTRSGIRTHSSPGGAGFNEIAFDDATGREVLSLRAERDLVTAVNHDRTARVTRSDSTVAGESVHLFIADSQTGIEMSRGRILLTTGEAAILLEGGEVSITAKGAVSVFSAQNRATPSWKDGAPQKEVPVAQAPKKAPESGTPTAPVRLPVAPEAPRGAKPCVKLGPNKRYKAAILEASERTGMSPYALAALIDAEAAKEHGVWNPNSVGPATPPNQPAVGLTQFMSGTWKDMALKRGTALNQAGLDAGYVQKVEEHVKGKLVEKFVVAPGKADELLALRTDPRLSIVTAAEYAKGNLARYPEDILDSATTDDRKAWLAYLAHHEGSGGAISFLHDDLDEERAAKLLRNQFGPKNRAAADAMIAKEGSAKVAYKKWLTNYIDQKIVPSRYHCSDESVDGDEAPAKSKGSAK